MAYALHRPQFARRSPLLGFIILMHAVVIYFVNAGIRIELPLPQPDLSWVDIAPQNTTVRPEPIPLPEDPGQPVELAPPAELPPVVLEDPPEAVPVATVEPEPIADFGEPVQVPRTRPSLDPRRPIGKPPYPPQSLRMNEQGLVRVSACVQPDGRLTGIALAASSGYPLLDEAAVKHLRRPGTRLRPGTEHGRPVTMCTTVPIRFDIRDR